MKTWHVVAALGVGILIGARFRGSESACCARVADAVRDKVGTKLGREAQTLGDLGNLWGLAPGILDGLGVDT
jgi:hypothetical protein